MPKNGTEIHLSIRSGKIVSFANWYLYLKLYLQWVDLIVVL